MNRIRLEVNNHWNYNRKVLYTESMIHGYNHGLKGEWEND